MRGEKFSDRLKLYDFMGSCKKVAQVLKKETCHLGQSFKRTDGKAGAASRTLFFAGIVKERHACGQRREMDGCYGQNGCFDFSLCEMFVQNDSLSYL